METEIKVPNIGDFEDVEVIEVLVSKGQVIKKNDPLITIESDKSSVEIPSNFDGKIKTLKTKVGDKVSEGDLILILESESQTNENIVENKIIEKKVKKTQIIKPEIKQNLIDKKIIDISSASPKARKFARELGININQVVGSEKDGRIIEDDIKKFVATRSKITEDTREIKSNKFKNEFNIDNFNEPYTFYTLGFNLRPTELTGVLGSHELGYLDETIELRKKNFFKLLDGSIQNENLYHLNT